MAYDLATVTNSGNQLLASVVSDKSSLVIDKIEVSNTQLASSTDLKSMKSISNVVKTLSANGYQKKDTSFIISTVLDNSSVDADYKAWVFGIWAHETDGGSPILMSVITSTSYPDTISKGSGTPIDYNYKFITTFSNTSSLTIKMASDTYATNDTVLHNSGDETATGTKTFQEIKISNNKFPSLVQTDGKYITLDGGNSEIVPADDSKVVHTTGDETIDGKKKFDTDPTDSAGNAYAKTVDVNQQLDKKVNVADMRKPASDVAGIEEVNAKQDKISYTPADDSKVVHSTVTELNSTDMNTVLTAGFYQLNSGTNGMPNADAWTIYQVIPINGQNGVQVAHGTNNTILGMRSWNDNGKFSFTSWVQFADDSKVAHLSGANNFDTVPTVNNNPLLLASSLPSDLARTGQANTFTQSQTFSIAPVINDASTDKGDNQAATMADLKSVKASAWRQLDEKKIQLGGTLLYKIDQISKRIYVSYASNYRGAITNDVTLADFSSIVKNIKTISGILYGVSSIDGMDSMQGSIVGLSIGEPTSIVLNNLDDSHNYENIGLFDGAYFTYDSLVNN